MSVFCVEVTDRAAADPGLLADLRELGLPGLQCVTASRLILLEGPLSRPTASHAADRLLRDPVTESVRVIEAGERLTPPPGAAAIEVHLLPGVMDPVAETTLAELRAEGIDVTGVRTARRFVLHGVSDQHAILRAADQRLANDCVERIVWDTAGAVPAAQPPMYEFRLRRIALPPEDDGLARLSRDGHLFLSLEEMRAIRAHFRALDRDPTDLELETIAQTWSEHCVHKTLKSAVVYRGAPLPGETATERRFANLLKDTIVRATQTLIVQQRGPECLSVFQDNAGIIGFDERYGLAFKVETHNHPSAIEPYGGAATGVGGCIRDVIGCGLGARPIANTDVFCVAPADWPLAELPKGVLHPWRVLRGVIRGVADYGNRMGIPTINGAVYFDPRFLGNPLVFCGCVGLIPRDRIAKAAQPGDRVVVIGGRTGRDGIHGATFSSAELTDTHADEFAHAVQIGNAITEKRILDAVLAARDAAEGCLYSAITDCGAGGLSSAVGEMAAEVGAVVDLEAVPLKYAGLRYDEIWISEAQERMVLAVPPAKLERLLAVLRAEEVEATVIGHFGDAAGRPSRQLVVRYDGTIVGELELEFLHHGLPRSQRVAEWSPPAEPSALPLQTGPARAELRTRLAHPTVASKEWIIRRYDHEVQGGSVVKPLCGRGAGPTDAAVLRPRLDSAGGAAIGCGLAPHLGDDDPYWMAIAAIDEALRNVVCVGGNPGRTAILDNFCWGRTDDPRQLGALVRTCQACHDAALAYGTPFISGKDSLNNEFALDEADVERVIGQLERYAQRGWLSAAALAAAAQRARQRRRLSIPGTLLVSAVSLIADVRRCLTADLKRSGAAVLRVGGLPQVGASLERAAAIHHAVAEAIDAGLVRSAHDISDGGWLVALAEMAIAGERGVRVATLDAAFEERLAGYVVETECAAELAAWLSARSVTSVGLGEVTIASRLELPDGSIEIAELRAAWTTLPTGAAPTTPAKTAAKSC